MGKLISVEPSMLISGFIFSRLDAYTTVLGLMEKKFGKVQFESETFDFSHTEYYKNEMGEGLKRGFVSFGDPVPPDRLKNIKLTTIKLEKRFLNDSGGRTVNIDPGLVGLANLVLASTKDFAHRIYLGDGIFGEVSLLFENKTFTALKWTYPDYQKPEVIEFLLRVRENLKEHIISLRRKS